MRSPSFLLVLLLLSTLVVFAYSSIYSRTAMSLHAHRRESPDQDYSYLAGPRPSRRGSHLSLGTLSGYRYWWRKAPVAGAHAPDPLPKRLVHESVDPSPNTTIATVQGLLTRLLGATAAQSFALEVIPQVNSSTDVFELDQANSKIVLRGNNGVSMASALNFYLRNYVNRSISWTGDNMNMPAYLPLPRQKISRTRSARFSYYQNVCTVSYSMAWWNWTRWEREMDWMALNGINMPLSFTGQEKIWQLTYNSLNISNAELDSFFSGQAFFAWQRMGNLRGWAGPLSQALIDSQAELQKSILQRQLAYGMVPVLPAFGGHIPEAISTHFPKANVTRSPNWGNFPPQYCCDYFLEPTDSLYQTIGNTFVSKYNEFYGQSSSIYNADQFNEMNPHSSEPAYLQAAGNAQYKSIVGGDPQGIWLMQGWLFQSGFWGPSEIQAYLSGAPNSGMIILDLMSDNSPVFDRTNNYYGKSYIWCELHNFGGNNGMYGKLGTVMYDPYTALQSQGSTMVGYGITMEGINQNSIVYEMILDNAWRSNPMPLTDWVTRWVTARYGQQDQPSQDAWVILKDSVYNYTNQAMYWGVTKSMIVRRPSIKMQPSFGFMPTAIYYDPRLLVVANRLLLDASDKFSDIGAYRYDVVDVTRQTLSNLFIKYVMDFIAAAYSASLPEVQSTGGKMLQLIADMDTLVGTSEHFLLGRWIASARAMGSTDNDKDLLEFNARNQVTRWGPDGQIADYASKQWSGLISDYYLPRYTLWYKFIESAVSTGQPYNETAFNEACDTFEISWQDDRSPYPVTPQGDSIAVARTLLNKYQPEYFRRY